MGPHVRLLLAHPRRQSGDEHEVEKYSSSSEIVRLGFLCNAYTYPSRTTDEAPLYKLKHHGAQLFSDAPQSSQVQGFNLVNNGSTMPSN